MGVGQRGKRSSELITAVVGFKRNLCLVVAALFGHGLFDLVHADFITNAGAPGYWPAFYLSYDIGVGACLA